MNLIIDQGNTYCKLAFFNNDELVQFLKINNKRTSTLASEIDQHAIEKAIVSSVSDDYDIVNILRSLDIDYISMNNQCKLPIDINYDTPETLGLDRVAAAAGAHHRSPRQTCLIIDIGTAVTYDICTISGAFIGGNIAPGLDMRLQALHTFTKRLPLVERAWSSNHWAKSTQEALRNGAQEGIIAEIEFYINKARQEFEQISVFLTGGDAIFFEKKIKNDIFVAPNLVLEGLLEILKIN